MYISRVGRSLDFSRAGMGRSSKDKRDIYYRLAKVACQRLGLCGASYAAQDGIIDGV